MAAITFKPSFHKSVYADPLLQENVFPSSALYRGTPFSSLKFVSHPISLVIGTTSHLLRWFRPQAKAISLDDSEI